MKKASNFFSTILLENIETIKNWGERFNFVRSLSTIQEKERAIEIFLIEINEHRKNAEKAKGDDYKMYTGIIVCHVRWNSRYHFSPSTRIGYLDYGTEKEN